MEFIGSYAKVKQQTQILNNANTRLRNSAEKAKQDNNDNLDLILIYKCQ